MPGMPTFTTIQVSAAHCSLRLHSGTCACMPSNLQGDDCTHQLIYKAMIVLTDCSVSGELLANLAITVQGAVSVSLLLNLSTCNVKHYE